MSDCVERVLTYLCSLSLFPQIAPYFAKVECFCFEEQKLLAGEEVDMPLLFFIDKDVLDETYRKAGNAYPLPRPPVARTREARHAFDDTNGAAALENNSYETRCRSPSSCNGFD